MKERPMLFNGDMVRAILAGRKTQTRRPVKIDMANAFDPPRGKEDVSSGYPLFEDGEGTWHKAVDCCPFGQVGDRIWVRETWQEFFDDEIMSLRPRGPRGRLGSPSTPDRLSYVFYRSDGPLPVQPPLGRANWRPSIHMPRWASRITLEVTAVRVEMLQDISEDDAMAEGGLEAMVDDHVWYIPGYDSKTTRDPISAFEHVWNACYSARGLGWDDNPWVWVIDFKMVKVD